MYVQRLAQRALISAGAARHWCDRNNHAGPAAEWGSCLPPPTAMSGPGFFTGMAEEAPKDPSKPLLAWEKTKPPPEKSRRKSLEQKQELCVPQPFRAGEWLQKWHGAMPLQCGAVGPSGDWGCNASRCHLREDPIDYVVLWACHDRERQENRGRENGPSC